MAGTLPIIVNNSIAEISGLTKRPVFFVKMALGNPGRTTKRWDVVFKGEYASAATATPGGGVQDAQRLRQTENSIHWGSKLMRTSTMSWSTPRS